jgi:hypothetical protein
MAQRMERVSKNKESVKYVESSGSCTSNNARFDICSLLFENVRYLTGLSRCTSWRIFPFGDVLLDNGGLASSSPSVWCSSTLSPGHGWAVISFWREVSRTRQKLTTGLDSLNPTVQAQLLGNIRGLLAKHLSNELSFCGLMLYLLWLLVILVQIKW